MRCPKCSFISFDIVESCTKCGKNISKAAEGLLGTIAEVVAPRFLRFEAGEPEPEAESVEFDISEDVLVEGEPEIDLAIEELAEDVIGISDLAPSDEVGEESVEDEVVFEDEGAANEAAPLTDHEAGELEDLEVEGIDLESKPAAGGKVMPSVKTGTALDDFDIDLGDLIPGKKDE